VITGGLGDDVILFSATANPAVVDGGAGTNILQLAPGGGTIDFSTLTLTNFGTIVFTSGGSVAFSYAQLTTSLPIIKGGDAGNDNLIIKTTASVDLPTLFTNGEFDNKIDMFSVDGALATTALTLKGFIGTAPVAATPTTPAVPGYMPDNILTGGAGNDIITGGINVDTLTGGASDDSLTGGLAADVLTGGAGNDRFIYTAANTVALLMGEASSAKGVNAITAPSTATVDTITDFVSGQDKIVLSTGLSVPGLTATALVAADLQLFATGFISLSANTAAGARFYFDMANNVLFFDELGDTVIDKTVGYTAGAADDFAVVKLTGVTTLAISDFTSA
jgi:Ca2+-binding RTX toxin-like protein